jgi:VWA domain-containing protein
MSLSTRSDRRALPAAVLLALVALVAGLGTPAAAAPVPLPIVAVLPGDQQTTLVVDLSSIAGPVARSAATVTVDGTQIPSRLEPVVSDLMTVAFVIDTSAAGRAALSSWLSAATRFVLEAPTGTQAVAVADTTPPKLITPSESGPVGMVRALSGLRAGGDRSTSSALTLAARQFPATPVGRRVVVLYTTAADAGGESAAALSARFRQAGAILVAVGTAADSAYWADAARRTGGFFAPVGVAAAVPALDQVETALGGRYLVQFATPSGLPTRAQVRVDAPELSLTGQAVIPQDATPTSTLASPWPGTRAVVIAAMIVAALLILIAGALVLRRRPAPAAAPVKAIAPRAEPSAIARGRAAVPLAITAHPDFMSIAVARGRAAVPHAIGPAPSPPALPAAPERPPPPEANGAGDTPATAAPEPADDAAEPAQPVGSTPPRDAPGPPWR